MPEFYTLVILLINQSEEIGEKQLSVFGSRRGQNSPLLHVAQSFVYILFENKCLYWPQICSWKIFEMCLCRFIYIVKHKVNELLCLAGIRQYGRIV